MESTNAKNARRRIAMRNGRRIRKMKEDIGTLRDILRDVCQRLTRMESTKHQRNEEQVEFFSCEEISMEDEEVEKEMDEEKRAQPEQEQNPPQPLDSSHSDTETNETEPIEEDAKETPVEQKWNFTWPFSRENPGPWSIGYIMNMKIIANEEIPKVGTEWKFCYPFSRDKPGPYLTDYVKARIEEERKPSELQKTKEEKRNKETEQQKEQN
eukprot:TRINITY_DN1649_c0_g2_i3.p1 TRINITY_DN1649_c0_g2~~TRINITY_DN1649_c0_g2_i3.p1  ORF type:complete len:211 (+),score=54.80 TRINITY_DN1649_c0_g2_i3:247-879(+)